MSFRIDGGLYPDEPPPAVLESLAERVDFLARLCSAWDFGILPDAETLREIRRSPSWEASPPPCWRIRTSSSYEGRTEDTHHAQGGARRKWLEIGRAEEG